MEAFKSAPRATITDETPVRCITFSASSLENTSPFARIGILTDFTRGTIDVPTVLGLWVSYPLCAHGSILPEPLQLQAIDTI